MAKSKVNARGAAPGAPRPKIEPQRIPTLRKPIVRWTALAVVLAGILAGVLVALGARSATNTIRSYDERLTVALEPFTAHQAATAPQSFTDLPTKFAQGQATPKQISDAAARWETDFTLAATQVRALSAPGPLTLAQDVIAESMDEYAGVARLYASLADLHRSLADLSGGARKRLTSRLDQLGGEIEKTRARADNLFSTGTSELEALKQRHGLSVAPAQDLNLPQGIDPSTLGGLVPDGGNGG